MEGLLIPLAMVAGVLLLSSLTAGLVERGPISFPIIFLGLGILLGPAVTGAIELDLHAPVLELTAFTTLALVLFLDAVRLEVSDMRDDWILPAVTLGPGTLTIVGGIAVVAHLVFGLSPALAVVVGGALASTDPVVLRDVLRDSRLPGSVRRALSIEAGTNDLIVLPVVLIGVAIASAKATSAAGWALFFVQLFLVGPLLGAAIGVGGARAVAIVERRTPIRNEHQAMFGVGLVLAAFGAGELLGADGFLASFAAGAAVTLTNHRLCDCFLEFGEAIAEMLMLLSFVLFGIVLSSQLPGALTIQRLLFAVVVVFIARPIVLGGLLSIRHLALSNHARAFIAWFGPRGLNSLLLGLLAVRAGVSGAEEVFSIIGVVVMASVILHGVSATPLATAYTRALERRVTDEEREPTATGLLTHPNLAAVPRIEVDELAQRLASDHPPIVVDVRTRSAYDDTEIIPSAIHLAPDEVHTFAAGLAGGDGLQVVTYCTCANEATAARFARRLNQLGIGAAALRGGLDTWREQQPVVRGSQA